jgi:hypothetical protein
MSGQSEACRANARRCFEIADTTCTPEDECEYISFAESWQRLANEIECIERLVALIDALAVSNPIKEDTEQKLDQLTDRSSAHSLRRLTTAIVSISSHLVAEHSPNRTNVETDQNRRA